MSQRKKSKDETPRCGECQRELIWQDYAYLGVATETCKRCRRHDQQMAERGEYVKIHAALNRAGRRLLGLRRQPTRLISVQAEAHREWVMARRAEKKAAKRKKARAA